MLFHKNGQCARKIGLADVDTSMNIERHVCSNIFNIWWNSNIKLIGFHQLKINEWQSKQIVDGLFHILMHPYFH